ncbi:DUF2339 domain-containing protein [Sphingomonas sp. R86521]|uniref:DUF2339 domain-containing protein n=1 Tax=Sphingomonas sp. R86521 TaxID=3093860 RepID=UPI0036D310B9
MIVWIAILGALAGWCLVDFEEYGLLVGGAFGLLAGWVLRRAVRAELTVATKALQDQIDALVAGSVVARPEIVETEDAAPSPFTAPATYADPPTPEAVVVRPEPEPAAGFSDPPRGVAAVRAVAATPAEPGAVATAIAAAIAAARAWLFGGNTIVRVGLIILFVGLSFLASYAASAGLFPIELRLALVGIVGTALLAVGFRTRDRRPGFGLALQGAGIATLYLTLFAAARLYDTVPMIAAFALMIVVCALGCALALLQRSQALAATAFAGGFAVPLLLGGGGGSIVGVFVYYTILNLAILVIAQRQAWRVLNLIGVIATFGVAAWWGVTSYQPADFVAAQSFLIVSVLIYVATAVLYTGATPGRLGAVVDSGLVFGPALAGFGLEVGLVHDDPWGSAFAALGFAALYLGVAAWTMRYRREGFRVMTETMLAIGIGFVTLAVPLALGARWTSATWALEGAGAFWVGMRQARWMPRLFGILLQLLAALIYMGKASHVASALPLANPGFIGAMLIALAALATAWCLRDPLPHSESAVARSYARLEATLAQPTFLFGFAFWCAAWAAEAMRIVPSHLADRPPVPAFDRGVQPLLVMLACIASAWVAQTIGRRWRWPVASWPSHVTLVALVLGFASALDDGRHVLYLPDAIVWLAAIGLHLHMLYRNDADAAATGQHPLLDAVHIGGVWLVTAMLADCLWLGIDRARLWSTAWAEVSLLSATVAVLLVLTLSAGRAMTERKPAMRWPLDRHASAYGWVAAIPIAILSYLGAMLTAVGSSGNTTPLPYLPVLNPVDLSLGLALAGLALWRRTMLAANPPPRGVATLATPGALAALAGLAFVIINTIWLRLAHHLFGVAWGSDALLGSVVVQTGLAILWTSLALALMVLANRRAQRALWLVGAGLLALTVAKLLLVDLNTAGGGARIVAFIGVGVLMLVVGYIAPLPPKTDVPNDRSAVA